VWVPDFELIQLIADEMVARDVGRVRDHDSVERIGRCFATSELDRLAVRGRRRSGRDDVARSDAR
jgi:hypothetical protein